MLNRQRFNKRVREDVEILRDRFVGKRIVTSDPHIASHDGWKCDDMAKWEPRVYFCQPIGTGIEKDIAYDPQPASRFLCIPGEIRTQILEYTLPPQMISQKTETSGIKKGDAKWMNTSAVIFTCKQLYVEGRALALEKHTFEYERFPRRTRWGAKSRDAAYSWDLVNVLCDTKTNVMKHVYYG